MEKLSEKEIRNMIESKLSTHFGIKASEASKNEFYKAVSLTVKDMLMSKEKTFSDRIKEEKKKRVYYLCMEFLVGRQLKNNILNLGVATVYNKALSKYGITLEDIYEEEPDPGLGNGGLGRLAACYLDSLATGNYPSSGYSICFENGLFKQKIVDGQQVELPDNWLNDGEVWLMPGLNKTVSVKFGGYIQENWNGERLEVIHRDYDEVEAIPYDLFITGGSENGISKLRLWKARDNTPINTNYTSHAGFINSVKQNKTLENISKNLYPSDDNNEGKLLRLSQQYFLVSASIQNIIAEHLLDYGSLDSFKEKIAIHINDTHPALVIPELMRILLDQYSYSWESAWDIVTGVVSYTNHTVLPEALEKWNVELFRIKLPRIYSIVVEINRRLCENLWRRYPGDWDRISRMSIISNGNINMANLCVYGSKTVNGVSKMHSQILKDTVFRDYNEYSANKFTNVTNGIAHRRWLIHSNPGLCKLIESRIGEGYKYEPIKLEKLTYFCGDASFIAELNNIKSKNKAAFSDYLLKTKGITLDPHRIFDVQVKRLHEYKRQLMNALKIIDIYTMLQEDSSYTHEPVNFIFGAKAAPGYYTAKKIIKLICLLAEDIKKDKRINEIINVLFIEDYNVSMAEKLIPAAEISEQISLAGKEASGTGNMKLMMNGAITLGTNDGANIEIFDAVGGGNYYSFGLKANEVDELWKSGYKASDYYNKNRSVKRIIDRLNVGFKGESFSEVADYLIHGNMISDPYMCLADYQSYKSTFDKMIKDYSDRNNWGKMSLMNIAKSGAFSSDYSIADYAENIWGLSPVDFSDAGIENEKY